MKKLINKNNKSVSKFQLGGIPIYRKVIYLDKDPGGVESPNDDLKFWATGLTPEERMDQTVQELTPSVNPITGDIIRNTYLPTTEQLNLKMIPLSPEEKLAYNVVSNLVTLPVQIGGTKLLMNWAGKLLSHVPKVGPIFTNSPRTVAATTGLGLGTGLAYADYNTYVDKINDLDKYLTGLHNFTPTDLENLKKVYGDDYLNRLFGWMNAFNYNVQALNEKNVYDITKNERDLSLTDPKSWIESGWLNWEDPAFLTYLAANNIRNIRPGRGARIAGNIIAPALWAAMKVYRFNDIQQNLKRERILKDIISVLRGQGFTINGSSTNLSPYVVQTNPQGLPLIDSTATPAGVMDSVPSVISEDINASEEQPRPSWLHNLEAATVDSTSNQ